MVTDQSGNLVARHDYLAFGEEIRNGYAGRPSNGAWGGLDTVSQKFTGKERDSESGLDYFSARYYGSTLGRFLSVDPANAGADPTNPQSWNGYAYVLNNPLTGVDLDGESCSDPNDPSIPCFQDNPPPPPSDQVPTQPSSLGDQFLTGLAGSILQLIQQAPQLLQQTGNFISQPRNPICLSASTSSGAMAGAAVGMTGLAGGPAVVVIDPAAVAVGGGAGYLAGMVSCMSSTGGGGGGGNSSGNGGTQVTSKTLWKDGKGGRIDVENPNPGQRPRQIHYQDQTGKYIYDPKTGQFVGAPNRVNEILSDPRVQVAIKKGLGYPGL